MPAMGLLMDNINTVSNHVVRDCLKLVVRTSPMWAEIIERVMTTSTEEEYDMHTTAKDVNARIDKYLAESSSVDAIAQADKYLTEKNNVDAGKVTTSQPNLEICDDCGEVFRIAENKEDSKHCAYHPGMLEWDPSIDGLGPWKSEKDVPGPWNFRTSRKGVKDLDVKWELPLFSWSCCSYSALDEGCVCKAHKY